MNKQVLFIQGGGNGGYKTDVRLVASLQAALSSRYQVHYRQMSADETTAGFASQWLGQIGEQITAAKDGLILAEHSLLVKYRSNQHYRRIPGDPALLKRRSGLGAAVKATGRFCAATGQRHPAFFLSMPG